MSVLILLFAAALASAQTIAIRNVTAVDVNGSRRTTVVISRGAIVAAGERVVVPKGARIIDGAGKFLIPGLWDMHVHLWDKQPMFGLYLGHGVTGIRDMGSEPGRTRGWKRDIDSGKVLGPRFFTPGPLIDGPGSRLDAAMVETVSTPDEARAAVDKIDDAGADFIKVMSRLSEDAFIAVAQRARVRRAVFAGHVPEAVPVSDAVDARMKSQEHLFGLALACSSDESRLRRQRAEAIAKKDYAALRSVRDRTYSTYNQTWCTELFRRMVRYGVWQTPTLTLRKRMSFLDLDKLASAPELRFVPDDVRSAWKDPREEAKQATPEQLENFREDYAFHAKLVNLMQRHGVGVLAGTDTGDPYVVPGAALHDELELLVEAGLSPAEALNTATVNAARYFNLETTQGMIAKGYVADLVLLDADPLADIRNTRRIAAVLTRGRYLDRKTLDELLAGREVKAPLEQPAAPKPAPRAKTKRRPARR